MNILRCWAAYYLATYLQQLNLGALLGGSANPGAVVGTNCQPREACCAFSVSFRMADTKTRPAASVRVRPLFFCQRLVWTGRWGTMAQTFSAREETTSLDSAIYTLPRVAHNGRYNTNLLRMEGGCPGALGRGSELGENGRLEVCHPTKSHQSIDCEGTISRPFGKWLPPCNVIHLGCSAGSDPHLEQLRRVALCLLFAEACLVT